MTLGSSVSSIGIRAFYGTSLTSLTIPDSVDSIGQFAFAKVPIQTLVVGKGLTDQSSVQEAAFYGVCPTLTSVTINSPGAIGVREGSTNYYGATVQYPWYTYGGFEAGIDSSSHMRNYGYDYGFEGLHFATSLYLSLIHI